MLAVFCLQPRDWGLDMDRIDSPLAHNVWFKASLGNNLPNAELAFVRRSFEVVHQEEAMET